MAWERDTKRQNNSGIPARQQRIAAKKSSRRAAVSPAQQTQAQREARGAQREARSENIHSRA